MPQIRLVFLWHQHQPFYKDLVTGEYRLPWVRMHALKDYFGMVKLLEEFPRVHQNFNLVPSLIVQMQDYLSGTARDPFLQAAARPARDLTQADKHFVLDYLFQANVDNMIGRYPRYRELWEKFLSLGASSARAVHYFQTQDYADLQVLSQIAWFDEFFLEQSDMAELVRKGRNFTEQDQRFVIARQREIIGAVLPAHANAARRGSIEISTSPFYHPILPLLCDSDIGAVSHPGMKLPQKRFQHAEDAREQIKRGLDLHERVFGIRPKGLWPSEGSVSEQVVRIASELGIEWMATDEGVLGRTLGIHIDRDATGKLSAEAADKLYRIYRYEKDSTQMRMVFRDHSLSDLIGFVYSGMPAKEAAENFIRQIRQSAEPVLKRGRDAVVSVILDGENAWEYYPRSGREFLRRLYDGIQSDPMFDSVTVSQAIARESSGVHTPVSVEHGLLATVSGASHDGAGQLSSITPGSWINANFDVWIGAPEDNRSWEYLDAAREFYSEMANSVPEAQRELAFEELLIAEGSDWNWWYGPEHHTANDRDFDELYRKHLSNVYQALGATPPDYLAQPIAAAAARPSFAPPTAYIRPRLDAEFSRYFDWIGAAIYTADRRAGAMHGKQFLLDSVYAGLDESNLYGRLDFAEEIPAGSLDFVVHLQADNSGAGRPFGNDRKQIRLEVLVDEGRLVSWKLREVEEGPTPPSPLPHRDRTVAGSDQRRQRGAELRVRSKSFEFKLPFTSLGAGIGSTIRLRFSIWRERLPVDALPIEGWIELNVLPEEELEANVYNYGGQS
ncbi:MAG TPA: glycoside hydrolase family 57 protein [Terriglobales bacterium]|nr:glycoside hydrolase family 57 protein [Terriglobales bacterium]